ncbi:MAG: TetR/AcrR family transcriptional regulator [Gammaproteobacteria bacterium]|nr:TetR/AcrR family transcriptional regulator [Gammaproteobacteria bacterium]
MKPSSRATALPWSGADVSSRERAWKRNAVILAAARAFAARGYHNTSLDDLAAALNVTKPTIYSYVDSKEELLFECFRQGIDQILAGFNEAETTGGTARERLMTVARHYAIAVTGDFGWCMVRLEEENLEKTMSAKIKTLKSEVDQGLRKLIRQGVADRSIRAGDPKMAAFALAGALNWIAHWHRANDALSPEEIANRVLEIFELGLAPR